MSQMFPFQNIHLQEAQLELCVVSSPYASEVVHGERFMLCFGVLHTEKIALKEKTDLGTCPWDAHSLWKLKEISSLTGTLLSLTKSNNIYLVAVKIWNHEGKAANMFPGKYQMFNGRQLLLQLEY